MILKVTKTVLAMGLISLAIASVPVTSQAQSHGNPPCPERCLDAYNTCVSNCDIAYDFGKALCEAVHAPNSQALANCLSGAADIYLDSLLDCLDGYSACCDDANN